MHKNVNKFLQSVVVFPVLATNLALAPLSGMIAGSPTAAVIFTDKNRTLTSEATANQQKDLARKIDKVDAYFAKHNLPLEGHGEKLVTAAEENDLPWPLLAAVAMQESTGGKFACRNDRENVFGYNSCRHLDFESVDQAIDTVARTLAAKNEKTARFYEGKDLETRLEVYNGRAVHDYADSVKWIMSQIEKQEPIAKVSDAKA